MNASPLSDFTVALLDDDSEVDVALQRACTGGLNGNAVITGRRAGNDGRLLRRGAACQPNSQHVNFAWSANGYGVQRRQGWPQARPDVR